MKAMLTLNLPTSCSDCPLECPNYGQGARYCAGMLEGFQTDNMTEEYKEKRADWCPLEIIDTHGYLATKVAEYREESDELRSALASAQACIEEQDTEIYELMEKLENAEKEREITQTDRNAFRRLYIGAAEHCAELERLRCVDTNSFYEKRRALQIELEAEKAKVAEFTQAKDKDAPLNVCWSDSPYCVRYGVEDMEKLLEDTKTREMNDPINRPAHYTDGNIEVIDFIDDKKLGFCLGNAVKYICRAGKKDPSKTIEDLLKAVWYIDHYIGLLRKEGANDAIL